MNEDQLIEGLRKGDRNAFEHAFLVYKGIVIKTIAKYVVVHEDAEELVQDVFVKAFRKIDQFNGFSKFSTWIIRIAINTSKNFLESIKRQNEIINKRIDIDEQYGWVSNLPSPEELVLQKDGRALLLKAMTILPERQRTALKLHYMEGLKQLEVSDIMGISLDAVESLIQRAKTKFRHIATSYE